MRTFPGQLRTAPGRFAGGGAGRGAGFRSSPLARSCAARGRSGVAAAPSAPSAAERAARLSEQTSSTGS